MALPLYAADTAPAAPTSPAAPAAKSDADVAYEALYAGYRTKLPEGLTPKQKEYWQFMDRKLSRFAEQGLAFATNFPADPRRWEPIVQMGYSAPMFLLGFRAEFDIEPERKNVELDEAATADFRRKHMPHMVAVCGAEDASDRQRRGAFQWLCLQSRMDAASPTDKPNLSVVAPLIDHLVAKFPNETGAALAGDYIEFLQRADPAEAEAFSAKIKSLPVGAALVAKKEKEEAEKKRIETLRNEEIGQIKFTAVDGREVDIAKLRGKVVLIDFWATWCGPCIAEIPNVVAAYDKYHDKGFEVIGITLESDVDDKKKMVAFTEKNRMPWPQYFDGKGWDNDLGRKFGIRAIPAMFLLDKDGKIASSEARGEKLEEEIKRLLGL